MNTLFSKRPTYLSKHGLRAILALALLAATLVFGAFSFAPSAHAASTPALSKTAVSPKVALACPPELFPGDQGTWVVVLQDNLNSAYNSGVFQNSPHDFHPYSQSSTPLAPDGIYGQNTTNAVYDFQYWWSQQEYKIDVDGIAGPQTWHALGVC